MDREIFSKTLVHFERDFPNAYPYNRITSLIFLFGYCNAVINTSARETVRKAQRWRCVESDKPARRPHKCESVPGNNKCCVTIIRVKGASSSRFFYRQMCGNERDQRQLDLLLNHRLVVRHSQSTTSKCRESVPVLSFYTSGESAANRTKVLFAPSRSRARA